MLLALERHEFDRADGFAEQRFRYPGHDWSTPNGYSSTEFLFDAAVLEGSAAGYGTVPLTDDLALPPADPRPNIQRPILKEGTPIRAADGTKAGDVATVTFAPEDGRLTSISMRWGLLDHERREIPLEWVEELDDKGLMLTVTVSQARKRD